MTFFTNEVVKKVPTWSKKSRFFNPALQNQNRVISWPRSRKKCTLFSPILKVQEFAVSSLFSLLAPRLRYGLIFFLKTRVQMKILFTLVFKIKFSIISKLKRIRFWIFSKTPKTVLLISQLPNIAQRLFCIQNERQDILYYLI